MSIVISHRGNLTGPNSVDENNPNAIDDAIALGLQVEIDVRYVEDTNTFVLGHDYPEYDIPIGWLNERRLNLWVHCKNIEAIKVLRNNNSNLNYFYHDLDECTLTSHGFPWIHPNSLPFSGGIFVLPELSDSYAPTVMSDFELAGVCTDFPYRYLQNVQ